MGTKLAAGRRDVGIPPLPASKQATPAHDSERPLPEPAATTSGDTEPGLHMSDELATTVLVLLVGSLIVLIPALLAWASASGRLSRRMWKRTVQQERQYAGKPYALSERDWGRLWEVGLTPATKNRIATATYRAERVQESREAAIAAEHARRTARSFRRVFPVWAGLATVYLAIGLGGLLVKELLLGLTFLILGVVYGGIAMLSRVLLRRAGIAERINWQIASREGSLPGVKRPPTLLY